LIRLHQFDKRASRGSRDELAAYNAGPNRIQSLRREAAKRGLDPNKWFNNAE